MGAENITDKELHTIDVAVLETMPSGSRKLEIPETSFDNYEALVKRSMDRGFWNEIVGPNDIFFIFKHKDGVVEQYRLGTENEAHIANLCEEFNAEEKRKTTNLYRYLAENEFYKDIMLKHYSKLVVRKT